MARDHEAVSMELVLAYTAAEGAAVSWPAGMLIGRVHKASGTGQSSVRLQAWQGWPAGQHTQEVVPATQAVEKVFKLQVHAGVSGPPVLAPASPA